MHAVTHLKSWERPYCVICGKNKAAPSPALLCPKCLAASGQKGKK